MTLASLSTRTPSWRQGELQGDIFFLIFIKFFQGGRTGAEFPHSGRSVPAESDQPAAPLVHQARHPGRFLEITQH